MKIAKQGTGERERLFLFLCFIKQIFFLILTNFVKCFKFEFLENFKLNF